MHKSHFCLTPSSLTPLHICLAVKHKQKQASYTVLITHHRPSRRGQRASLGFETASAASRSSMCPPPPHGAQTTLRQSSVTKMTLWRFLKLRRDSGMPRSAYDVAGRSVHTFLSILSTATCWNTNLDGHSVYILGVLDLKGALFWCRKDQMAQVLRSCSCPQAYPPVPILN